MPPGKPGQLSYTLTVKNFFLISSLNLPSSTLKPFPFILLLCPSKKSLPRFPGAPFKYWKATITSPQSLLFSVMKSPNCLSLFLVGEVLQPSGHLPGPSLDLFQQFDVLLVFEPQTWHSTLGGVSWDQCKWTNGYPEVLFQSLQICDSVIILKVFSSVNESMILWSTKQCR